MSRNSHVQCTNVYMYSTFTLEKQLLGVVLWGAVKNSKLAAFVNVVK